MKSIEKFVLKSHLRDKNGMNLGINLKFLNCNTLYGGKKEKIVLQSNSKFFNIHSIDIR